MNLIKVLTYVLVFVLGAGCYYMYIRLKISKANADANTIVEEANTKADNLIKEATLDAKTKAYEYKLEAEKASLWKRRTNFSSPAKSPLKTLIATFLSKIISLAK